MSVSVAEEQTGTTGNGALSRSAQRAEQSQHTHQVQRFWLWVLCMTGVDYFSTMGYIPSIAFEVCGWLAPIAILGIIGMTLGAALPVYSWVAAANPFGQGSIGMVESMARRGWRSKIVVIVLLGFAATDFIITITLSAADATAHLIENPLWASVLATARTLQLLQWIPALAVFTVAVGLWKSPRQAVFMFMGLAGFYAALRIADLLPHQGQQIWVTSAMIMALGVVFWIGFNEAIMVAVTLVTVYLALNAVVIGSGLWYIANHPAIVQGWWEAIRAGQWHVGAGHLPLAPSGGILVIIATAILVFPKLALGMSGFETGVAVMPLIRGSADDDPRRPLGRIRNTRKLLATAALIMSCMLLGATIVTTMLVPPDAFLQNAVPTAKDRALAYIAHGQTGLPINSFFGTVFGTVYDLSTTAILWFAGASALAGLLNLVPLYLPGAGMAPEWVKRHRPQVVTFTLIAILVTLIFRASVSAQGDAYATGVLALMLSACWAVAMKAKERWVEESDPKARFRWALVTNLFRVITLVFTFTMATVVHEKPVGITIASVFIVTTAIIAFVSRLWRNRELRHAGFRFPDEGIEQRWKELIEDHAGILVPHRPDGRLLGEKEADIRRRNRLSDDVPVIFIEVLGIVDSSQFPNSPVIDVREANGHTVIVASECSSVPHTLVAIALAIGNGRPIEMLLGWSEGSYLDQQMSAFFGGGDIAWWVRYLLRRAEPDEVRRPQVKVG